MSWERRGSRPRKENRGAPVKVDPHDPKARHHVFWVTGKRYELVPGHFFYKQAIAKALCLGKSLKPDSKTKLIVKLKHRVVWDSQENKSKAA